MENSQIKVNTVTLGNDMETINGYLKDLKTQKGNLAGSMIELNSMWSGEAYDAFVQAVNNDLQLLQAVIDDLTNSVYAYEVRAKSKYEECERQVSALIDGISIKEVE